MHDYFNYKSNNTAYYLHLMEDYETHELLMSIVYPTFIVCSLWKHLYSIDISLSLSHKKLKKCL